MTFKIVQRTQVAGSYGVTPFDDESGDSLSDLFGTRILPTLAQATAWAEIQVARIQAVGDDASIEIIR
jgi:hypothetical protein